MSRALRTLSILSCKEKKQGLVRKKRVFAAYLYIYIDIYTYALSVTYTHALLSILHINLLFLQIFLLYWEIIW